MPDDDAHHGGRRPAGTLRRCAASLVAALLLGAAGMTAAAAPQPTGVVATLAGPGYCRGASTADAQSRTVRALAVDAAGRVVVESGSPGSGLIVSVSRYQQVTRLISGAPSALDPPDGGAVGGPSGASRLVPDGDGGVLLAAGRRVLHIDAGNGLTVIAGAGGSAGGDGIVDARSLAVDDAGNLFIADRVGPDHERFVIRYLNRSAHPVVLQAGTSGAQAVEPGAVATVAGSSDEPSPDGAPPRRLALDGVPPSLAAAAGRLYVASAPARPGARSSIRVINLTGGPLPAQGQVVAAGEAVILDAPGRAGAGYVPGMAASTSGDLFLADESNHRVLRVDAQGSVRSVAGGVGAGFNGNDRPAAGAQLNQPYDVKIGAEGRLFISDRLNDQVRMVDQSGIIRLVPGSGAGAESTCLSRGAGPETPGRGAPVSVASAANGDIIFVIADGRQVKRLDGHGTVTTIAGRGEADPGCPDAQVCSESGGDPGSALDAYLHRPAGLALTPDGDLGMLDAATARVRFVNPGSQTHRVFGVDIAPGAIATVAGNGRPGAGGDGGRATAASLAAIVPSYPFPLTPLAVDGHGNLYIADLGNHRVRRVDPGGTITTWAGQGALASRASCCTQPVGVAATPDGIVYVATSFVTGPGPRQVWALNAGGRQASVNGVSIRPGEAMVIAGGKGAGGQGDGGPALAATFAEPLGLAADRIGNLYVADPGESTIRRIDGEGRISTVAGTGAQGFNGDGLPGRLTRLAQAAGIAVDRCGSLLMADTGNDRVRRLELGPACGPPPSAIAEAPPAGQARRVVLGLAGMALAVAAALLWRRRSGGG